MSDFLGGALAVNVLVPPETRHCDEYFFGNDDVLFPSMILDVCMTWDNEFIGFANPWWPTGGNIMGGFDGVDENNLEAGPSWWSDPWYAINCSGRLAFVGITRDQFGSPLPGCTVRCFNTATNELVAQVVSDGNGFYRATTQYADGHYLVVHKAGSPEVAGASVSTLLPA